MKITVRKSDNKLITWGGGNDKNDPLLKEYEVSNIYPEGDFKKMFYDSATNSLIIKPDYIDPVELEAIKIRELSLIDSESIRPLRAVLASLQNGIDPDAEDITKLTELEEKAKEKRSK